jgi:hypothetical protein
MLRFGHECCIKLRYFCNAYGLGKEGSQLFLIYSFGVYSKPILIVRTCLYDEK